MTIQQCNHNKVIQNDEAVLRSHGHFTSLQVADHIILCNQVAFTGSAL